MKGIPCFLIGNGPSLEDVPLHLVKDYFSIGVNRVYLRGKFDPTILFWQDVELWRTEKKFIRKMKAIKYARSVADPENLAYHFKLRAGPFLVPSSATILYGLGASGPLSFELALCLGCNPIVLLGFDCKYKNGKTDFYGKNKDHKAHTLTRCRMGLKWTKVWQEKGRVSIINCSDNDVYTDPVSLEKALDIIKRSAKDNLCEPCGRDFYKERLFARANSPR